MMSPCRILLTLSVLPLICLGVAADETVVTPSPVTPATGINVAVGRSLPYIAKRGQWWIDAKDCVSCHRTTFTIWTHAAAAEAGLAVDNDQLVQWIDWSFEALLKKNDKDIVVATANLDGVAQLLHVTNSLALTDVQKDYRARLLAYLTDGQSDTGSWDPAGQLPSQKRPPVETKYVTTAWNHWLASDSGLSQDSRAKALSFLQQQFDRVSTESLVVDVLNATSDESRLPPLQMILAGQNEDGGFGWLRNGESDALATGQVLFAAASLADSKAFEDALTRAIAFLLTTQEDNGSWKVKGTKKNRQTKVQETATYWGTCWAVIGMLEIQKQRAASQASQQ